MRIATAMAMALLLGVAAAAEPPCWGRLSADSVRARSGPTLNHRDMGMLGKDTIVRVLTAADEGRWLAIVAPATLDAWVFGEYVEVDGARGVITRNKVNVRAVPDLNGEMVPRADGKFCQLDKGAAVTVKERRGAWVRIVPPPDTIAWVSADLVQRLTDAEKEALEAAIARRMAEEEERRAEEARKKQEVEVVQKAIDLFVPAMKVAADDGALDSALRACAEAERVARDPALRRKVGEAGLLLCAMRDARAALAQKTFPAPLPNANLEQRKDEPAVKELLAVHRQAEEIARAAQAQAEQASALDRTCEGWVSPLGPGLEHTGATQRITRDGRTVALVRSGQVDLKALVGTHVRAVGKLAARTVDAARQPVEVVEVMHAEPVFP